MTADILIAGSGISGLSAALALAQAQFSVMVIDAIPEPAPYTAHPMDLRVSAITPGNRDTLQIWGAWPTIAANPHGAFEAMKVWDASSAGAIHFNSEDTGTDYLGFIVENRLLRHALLTALAAEDQVSFRWQSPIINLSQTEKGRCITLADGTDLTAPLVIAADGNRSPLAEFAGIANTSKAYPQKAVVCHVQTTRPHQHTAWQRFLPTGTLAFLPLADPHQSSIVWATTPDDAEALLAQAPTEFNDRLALAFEETLGKVELISDRASFPLKKQWAQQYTQPGLALVGDAAHTVHPLAGQGANMGMADAKTLAHVLTSARQNGKSISSSTTLRRYERARKTENQEMLFSIDNLYHLFRSTNPTLQFIRGLGLNSIDRLPILKRWFMKRASHEDCRRELL